MAQYIMEAFETPGYDRMAQNNNNNSLIVCCYLLHIEGVKHAARYLHTARPSSSTNNINNIIDHRLTSSFNLSMHGLDGVARSGCFAAGCPSWLQPTCCWHHVLLSRNSVIWRPRDNSNHHNLYNEPRIFSSRSDRSAHIIILRNVLNAIMSFLPMRFSIIWKRTKKTFSERQSKSATTNRKKINNTENQFSTSDCWALTSTIIDWVFASNNSATLSKSNPHR